MQVSVQYRATLYYWTLVDLRDYLQRCNEMLHGHTIVNCLFVRALQIMAAVSPYHETLLRGALPWWDREAGTVESVTHEVCAAFPELPVLTGRLLHSNMHYGIAFISPIRALLATLPVVVPSVADTTDAAMLDLVVNTLPEQTLSPATITALQPPTPETAAALQQFCATFDPTLGALRLALGEGGRERVADCTGGSQGWRRP